MPARRSLGAVAGPSAPAAPPVVELHPIIKRLRRMWKFAAVCQFLFVFDEAFGMSGFESEALEADFANTQNNVVPDLIKRLLYTLTLDRTIDFDNWQHHLRLQYNLRDEDSNSRFGTTDQPIEWAQLSLEDKIATLHDLCEWQLTDPERFRKLVKSEEDVTTWRVSPIGWDAHDNAYWLFDDNRIWIQRPEPVPKAPVKARAPAKKGSKRARMEAAAARRAASAAAKSSPNPKFEGTKRRRPSDVTPTSTPSKRARSSLADSEASAPSQPPPKRGTRTSARFAPQENDFTSTPTNGGATRSAASSYSSESELSEPPETLDDEEENDKGDEHGKVETAGAEEFNALEPHNSEAQQYSEDEKKGTEEEWVEFEAIVVTRQEWLEFAKRFARSKDPNEKNLHQFINNEVLNQVLAAMDEIDRQRAMELALANRKRSSRIAMKESEREERERDREARARMEQKMALIRQEEEQKRQKEEEEQEAQRSREIRLREREERLRARELENETKAIREEEERERRERDRQDRKRRREEIIANGGIPPLSKDSTPVPEDGLQPAQANGQGEAMDEEEEEWELNCEVCGKAAISPPDEDNEIVCCEQCGVWQHIKCWDTFDKQVVGLKRKRNWEDVDFFCSKCRPPPAGTPVPHPGILSQRSKASPSGNQRANNDPEHLTPRVDPAALGGNGESPRQRIKLMSGGKNPDAAQLNAFSAHVAGSGLAKPPTVASQTLRPPTVGALPAETGLLTSSSTMARPSPATPQVGQQLPPPSSHAVPTGGSNGPTVGRPLLPAPNVADRGVAGYSKPDAATPSKTNGAGAALGLGRPAQTSHSPAITSPRSPSSGAISNPSTSTLGNGVGPLSPRSPSSSAALGNPTLRRPSQPLGSFPMRHTPAKSPLSRPYESQVQNGDPTLNGFSIGPPRAASPSANRGGQSTNLGASASSLHPSSAAAVPVSGSANLFAASTLGSVVGGAFAPAFSDAPVCSAAPTAPSSGAVSAVDRTAMGAPLRPELSSTGSDSALAPTNPTATHHTPKSAVVDVNSLASEKDAKEASSAATNAFRTLEHSLSSSPQPAGKIEGKVEEKRAAEVKVVELPPTHIETS